MELVLLTFHEWAAAVLLPVVGLGLWMSTATNSIPTLVREEVARRVAHSIATVDEWQDSR